MKLRVTGENLRGREVTYVFDRAQPARSGYIGWRNGHCWRITTGKVGRMTVGRYVPLLSGVTDVVEESEAA